MALQHLDDVYEELFLYGLVRRDTLEKHASALRPYLCEKANNHDMVTYDEATDELDTSRQYLGRVLGAINECEHRAGNPLLTAIVVSDPQSATGYRPSIGFFSWPCIEDRAPDCWVHPDSIGSISDAQHEFWEDERDRVWAFYSGN